MQTAKTFGFDTTGKYDGTKKYFWAFHSHLEDLLLTEGLLGFIGAENIEPLSPDAAIFRQQNLIQPAPGDFDQLAKYHGKMQKYKVLSGKAYEIVKNSLGPTPLSCV